MGNKYYLINLIFTSLILGMFPWFWLFVNGLFLSLAQFSIKLFDFFFLSYRFFFIG